MILFNEESHTYYDSETFEVLDSVSTIISTYKNKFDSKKISEQYVINHNLDKTPEEVRKEWKDINTHSIYRGKRQHFLEETLTFLLEASGLNKDYNDGLDLNNIETGIYPELRLHYKNLYLSGTADKIEIFDNKEFDIDDYKTNIKPMQMQGFRGQTMFYPLNHLQDCNYNHYELQLNIYAFILSLYGYKPRNLRLIHKRFLDDEPIPDKYRIPFISEEKQREPIIYNLKIDLEKTKEFILYDYKRRISKPRRMYIPSGKI